MRNALLFVVLLGACVEPVTYTPDAADDEVPTIDASIDAGIDASIDADATPPTPALIVEPEGALAIDEATDMTFTVRLSEPPEQPMLLELATDDDVLDVPAFVLIDDEDWSEPRAVRVSALRDDDVADGAAQIVITSNDLEAPVTVEVAVNDPDTLGVAMSPMGPLDLDEGDATTLSVALTARPAASMTLAVTAAGAVSASATTLQFAPEAWDVPQAITVTAAVDVDVVDGAGTVTLSAPPEIGPRILTVTVTDLDQQAILPSTTSVSLTEDASAPLTVRLQQQPSANVIVSIVPSDAGAADASASTLTFRPDNWSVPQPVTITAVDDDDDADESAAFTLSVAADPAISARTINVSIADPDQQALVASAVEVTEGGTASLGVRLAYRPAAAVTVSASSADPATATVEVPTSVTIQPASFEQVHTLTVRGQADDDAADDATAVQLLALSLGLSRDVGVTVDDDDPYLIVPSPTSLTVVEGGTQAFTVRLSAPPPAPVSVSVTSSSSKATVPAATLDFTASNWNTGISVLVTGADDDDLADVSATLTLAGAGLPNATVAVTVDDTDTQGVQVATTSVTVGEGANHLVAVTLTHPPLSPVSVGVTSAATGVATVTPDALSFDATNYHEPKFVTITGAPDADSIDGSTTISLTSPGATSAAVAVSVTDDDVAYLTSLAMSYAGAPVTNDITPAIAPTTLGYAASVGLWLQRVQLTATVQPAGATVTINGVSVTPGSPSTPIELALGASAIPVAVSHGGATRTYTLTVTRGATVAQQAYLKASNTGAGDEFGTQLAMWGDTLVVAAHREDGPTDAQVDSGAVYVFVRSGATWTQQALLRASNAGAGDQFGRSVAIHGDTIAVGAEGEDGPTNASTDSGAAYVFVRSGGTWTQQAYVRASDAAANDGFGGAVSVWGDTLAVGAERRNSVTGAVYVFTRASATWTQQAIVTASNGGTNDNFGEPLALWGETLLVSADTEDGASNTLTDSGAAYVFVRSGTTWSEQAILRASNAGSSDLFSWRLALSGDTAVIGAPHEDSSAVGINGDQTSNGATSAGAAYVFVRSGTTWTQQAYLKASNTGSGDQFGASVGIWGDTIAVRAILEDSNATGINGNQADNTLTSAGAVYVFTRSGTTWTQSAYVKASNSGSDDQFGDSVTVSGDTVVAGADHEDSNGVGVGGNQADNTAAEAGATYVFR